MFSSTIIVSALAAFAAANPMPQSPAQQACPVGGSPQCCQLDVLQLADVSCRPPGDLSSVQAFQEDCSKKGETAQCCILPILGQALLCQQPNGGAQNQYPSGGSNVPAGQTYKQY